MKVVLATGHAYPPQQVGGSELSAHQLCLALGERGMNVSVLARWTWRHPTGPAYALAAATARAGLICDKPFGYPVFRARDPGRAAAALVERIRPDIAVINAGEPMRMAQRFTSLGVPVLVYIRDGFFGELGGPVCKGPLTGYVTTSQALAARIEDELGVTPVCIPPVVLPEFYRVETTRQAVTFVCPHPRKGLETAIALAARRPDIPFLFQESWPIGLLPRRERDRRIAALPNVTLLPRTLDMRPVYARTRLVLIPTPGYEAWGRVASEAQVSGIPVLASNVGGLPEAVGPGGLVVDPGADIDVWEAALSRLWDDEDEYRRLSAAALAHAARPEFQPGALTDRLTAVIRAHAART
ncbi:MAG: glycosyltransferase [Sphingomonadales bacterium]